MNRKSLIFLTVAAAFAVPAAAQAPRTSGGSDSMAPKTEASATAHGGFAGLDKNNDGYISRDEALEAPWVSRFSEIDKDNDGRVSRSEFDASQGAARGATGTTSTPAKKPEKPMK